MSLRHKLLMILGLIWVALIGLTYLASQYVITAGHTKLEQQYAERNVKRLVGAFEAKLAYVTRHNMDLAKWHRTHHFLNKDTKNRFQEFYKKNKLIDREIGLYTLWSNDGELINGYNYDFNINHFLPIPKDLASIMKKHNALRMSDAGYKGLVQLHNGYWLMSIQPVFANKKRIGISLIGLHLTTNRMQALGDMTQLNYQIINFAKATELNYLTEHVESIRKNNRPYVEHSTDKIAHGYTLINDMFSNPIAILKVGLQRDIVNQGQSTVYMMYAFLLGIATLVTLSIWQIFNVFILKRLETMSKQVLAYDVNDEIGSRIEIKGDDELAGMAQTINKMLDVINSSHTTLETRVKERTDELLNSNKQLRDEIKCRSVIEDELREKEAQLKHMAHYDALTNLPNRIFFHARLAEELKAMAQEASQLAVLFLDIDRFKYINDALGHDFGDLILQQVAVRVQSVLRSEDMIARIGGDEFVIYSSRITAQFEVDQIATRIIQALATPIVVHDREFHISMSIGASFYPDDGQTIEDLESCADVAMYRAKSQGGNQFHYYTRALNIEVKNKLNIETKLRQALSEQQLNLFYQPILDASTKNIVSVEALCRWEHPEMGTISPTEFIPIAEETGLIYALGNWALREACQRQVDWINQGYQPVIMAVNVSAMQFRDANFVNEIMHIIEETGIDPSYLELELTESVFAENIDCAFEKIQSLKNHGVRLALDDFGTGYSSMGYLKQVPIDTIKIDQSFVTDLGSEDSEKAITDSVITLGHNLGICVLAEGIETLPQLNYLTMQGCDRLQGFLFTQAVSEANLLQYFYRADTLDKTKPSTLWPQLENDSVIMMPIKPAQGPRDSHGDTGTDGSQPEG